MEEERIENSEDNNLTEEKRHSKKGKPFKYSHKKGSSDSSVEKIEELNEKLAEINDKYLRLYSEFDNYRKRTIKEKADLIKFGGEDVIKSLLPIVDDFERAIQSMEKDGTQDSFRDGIILIYNKFKSTLEQKGLKPINAKGQKFDEELHEAVSHVPAANESEKGTIIEELEKGYFLNDKVIRYSKVVVAI